MTLHIAEGARLAFQSVARSHPGSLRTLNEDRVLDRCDLGLWAVADGLGGHMAGDRAAEDVVSALAGIERPASAYAYLSSILSAITSVNASLYAEATSHHANQRMGATLAALIVHGEHAACVWAGDSRAYLLRDRRLKRLTRDHSVVQALVDSGFLSEAEGAHHPKAHVVLRAVGAEAEIELERCFTDVMAGDMLILCTDGLTAALDDAAIERIVVARSEFEMIADRLMDSALREGARDNVSFILVEAVKSTKSEAIRTDRSRDPTP